MYSTAVAHRATKSGSESWAQVYGQIISPLAWGPAGGGAHYSYHYFSRSKDEPRSRYNQRRQERCHFISVF